MKKLGCGCDMGCKCKQALGQTDPSRIDPLWFALGIGAGIGLWALVRKMSAEKPGETVAAPLPTVAPPSRYANLDSVAARLDQVKTLYRGGYLSPEQALAESEALQSAASGFSLEEGERVSEVIAAIIAFEDQVRDFIALRATPTIGRLRV